MHQAGQRQQGQFRGIAQAVPEVIPVGHFAVFEMLSSAGHAVFKPRPGVAKKPHIARRKHLLKINDLRRPRVSH